MKIPNYQTKIDRIISKAITSCVASPGIKIVIVCDWMTGHTLLDRIDKRCKALKIDGTTWWGGERITFLNDSELYVMDGAESWRRHQHEQCIDVAYVICDMWEIDSIARMHMGHALIPRHSEIHRIRYPSIYILRFLCLIMMVYLGNTHKGDIMVDIPNRDYRFRRMMEQVVLSCASPARGHNVGIVCLSGEEEELFNKIQGYISKEARPMSLGPPIRTFSRHGPACYIYRDTESSISILSEPDDFNVRLFRSIYIVGDALKVTGATRHCLASAILSAKVNVNLNNPATYNWS